LKLETKKPPETGFGKFLALHWRDAMMEAYE
jgi:hypothetical protein